MISAARVGFQWNRLGVRRAVMEFEHRALVLFAAIGLLLRVARSRRQNERALGAAGLEEDAKQDGADDGTHA
jgi:hypothetical protein